MATVYVIHAPEDRGVVEQFVIRPLPILGFDRWVSAAHLERAPDDAFMDLRTAMDHSDVILAVVSAAAAGSPAVGEQVRVALDTKRRLIPVRIDGTEPARIVARLGDLPRVDVRTRDGATDLRHLLSTLSDLLPVAHEYSPGDEPLVEAVPEDYLDRKGFDPLFLGSDRKVPLPVVRNPADVRQFTFAGRTGTELRYEHFSVVMSISRRLCLFSAVNIDGRRPVKKRRVGWRSDPRIPADAQIRNECYGDPPRFSRGHMTRREDPIWGEDAEAARGNADSMHVTNAVPQMQPFNAGIWLGLEDYALDHAREDDMRISVFTGPFFSASDPIRFGVGVPVRFWKIIAFIHDDTGELCATGYTMSQRDVIREEEFVFGRHETAQTSIAAIQQESGLVFGDLAALDPLAEAEESLAGPLTDPDQIRWTRRW